MLNFLMRTRNSSRLSGEAGPLAGGADPLKIRNLLDDPRLQAVMNTDASVELNSSPTPTPTPTPTPIRTDRDLVLGTAA